jgi:flagellar biosynthesis protein FliR
MQGEASLPLATLFSFLAVLARVSGAMVFVPIPGLRSGPQASRVVLALTFTIALFPLWPEIRQQPTLAELALWMVSDGALGLSIGLVVLFLTEAFLLCSQVVALQAGYAYASTVDPTTQADAGVLLVFAQLIAGVLFFTLGLHREILRIFAESLVSLPPGGFAISRDLAHGMVQLGGTLFSTGLRLSLPIVLLLVLVDLALALLGRINAQMQLISLAFPAKMLLTLVLLAFLTMVFPRVCRAYSGALLAALRGLLPH